MFIRGLRHVAALGDAWVALVGWQAAALTLMARDRWIGWHPSLQFRRLRSIAQNSRFPILPDCHRRNLVSRVPGLSLRRLSADIRVRYGHPVLLAETFVNSARFAGTCYRAANRGPVGFTPGYALCPAAAPRWEHHG